ncbi:assimilatory sulfite reductase (NADPH) flavoprotein subunit [Cognatilysobacter bugurensis]|uniref:Sulfite reductase [NADPH] flavoprotein alpha-component n=1 Tax=Cognatilysobacter bugurensis TaxID=543356 RepID=A0A918W8R0_9GAMM|nr:assimilatory sulfite reductase (NADPH) flavoprotein subunit [Lysobacter bugurensis]GHA77275.1 sulfite reductase [NADPH] flavoprotein alpha-component [Lysobacter bugurensis]
MSASPVPLLPPGQPLSPDQAALLDRLTGGLDAAGLWWLSGYAAGLARAGALPAVRSIAAPAAEAVAPPTLAIVYGSQTGNAKRLAESLASQAEAAGLAVRLLRADAYPTRELKNERYLVVVISTQGDGDPPDDARGFVEFIAGKRAPALPELKFAVLGLGDSSYPQFCEIGRRLDERLAELGAARLLERGDADLDLETVATPWIARALEVARETIKAPPRASVTPLRPSAAVPAAPTRDAPFAAELLANQRITGRGSDRDIRHLEISLEGSGLHYEPGDALGVWPVNPPALVDAVIATLGLDGEQAVTIGPDTRSVREALLRKRELTRITRPFLVQHAQRANSDLLAGLLAPEGAASLAALFAQQQLIDLLRTYPASWSASEFVAALRPLAPRLYSIASSQAVVGDEAHLTVAHVEYAVGDGASPDSLRWGAASNFLARTDEGERLPVFIEANERFRLPADASRDVIMIGPGTGVAPFRGFVQHRVEAGASGRNWLVFGNPHARTDFLYQTEWQDALKRGQLHRLDLAFSRDGIRAVGHGDATPPKTYVQHRLREHGRELFAWLESGAHLYVCGDATRMARDVHATLLGVIAEHGGRDAESANDYLNDLQSQGRYARDVY